MKFKYKLEPALRFRTIDEQMKQKEYLDVQAELNKTLAEIDEMYQLIDSSRSLDFSQQESGEGKRLPQGWTDSFIKGQKVLIEKKKHIAREQMMVVEEKKEIFIEAVKQRKALEKHKEKMHLIAKRENAKKESKFIDDIVTARIRRENP